MSRIETEDYDTILADEALMQTVRSTGRQLFGDNCAACHGRDGKGRANYPDLTDDDWLWGGGPKLIEQTMRVGINSPHPESRIGQMPAFGRDEMLDRDQVRNVAAYVYSLTHPDYSTPENIDRIEAGREVFLTTCAACHGERRQGEPGRGRSEPDGRPLDLRRRPGHHHRLRARRTAGPHADLGREADDGRDQDTGTLRPRPRDAAAMTRAQTIPHSEGVARLGARSGRPSSGGRRQRAPRLRGRPVAAGLRRALEGRRRRQRLSRRQVRLLREAEMGETDKSYWLLSETSGIGETRDPRLERQLPLLEGFRWLRQAGGISGRVRFPVWPTGSACFFCRLLSCGRSSRSGATTSCFPRLPGS